MIRFNVQDKEDDAVNISLMPLIDIIFNLLIFFMITAAITSKGINIDLPEAVSSEKLPSRSWEIVIDHNQKIIFNDVVITMKRLGEIMRAEKDRGEGERVSAVILKAHKDVPFGNFVTVMDMARENNLLNLVIATDTKKDRAGFEE